VCIDASVVVKLLVREDDSVQARALWRSLAANGHSPVAPALLLFETVSVLRRRVARKLLQPDLARAAIELLLRLPLTFPAPDGLVERTWQLADRFGQPVAYDCFYVALADLLRIPFWTADRRLYDAVRPDLDWVHLLGEPVVG
jgi:predicted nucleic acid-binding protein